MKKQAPNYLDYIPVASDKITYDIKDGKVTIYKEHKGIFDKIAQKVFSKPECTQIHLDEMGNFIWPLMDGQRDIMAIAALVKEEFGDKAEPLYNRIVQYFRTLDSYGFVVFTNSQK